MASLLMNFKKKFHCFGKIELGKARMVGRNAALPFSPTECWVLKQGEALLPNEVSI